MGEVSPMDQPKKCFAVVRVRGVTGIHSEVKETMNMLHLGRSCHATLVDDRASYLGMLRKAQNYLTWGEISTDTLKHLLKKRGRLAGDTKLSDEYAQRIGKKSLDELAEAIYKGEIEFQRLPDIKPLFRLHPPSKGFKGKIKRSYAVGDVSGYRGEAINKLLEQMM
jgi:large subunit ribosomal protein L30